MHIGSALKQIKRDALSPFRSGTLPGPRMDNVNEFNDPFRSPDVITSANSFLGSLRPYYPGNTDGIPKPPEQLATPVRCSVCPPPHPDSALAHPDFWGDRRSWRLRHWSKGSLRTRGLRGAQSSADVTSLRMQARSLDTCQKKWPPQISQKTRRGLGRQLG